MILLVTTAGDDCGIEMYRAMFSAYLIHLAIACSTRECATKQSSGYFWGHFVCACRGDCRGEMG